jgi:5'-nucleotidase
VVSPSGPWILLLSKITSSRGIPENCTIEGYAVGHRIYAKQENPLLISPAPVVRQGSGYNTRRSILREAGLAADMHILVTNDDGVTAPGLLELAKELASLGKVTILAPDRNWSAAGHAKTMDRPMRVKAVEVLDGVPAFATDGAPSDCVALAVLGFLDDKVDLVVSGINPNANLGHDMTYSGTVTAAMEALIWGLPGIAFSLNGPRHPSAPVNFQPAAIVARRITDLVAKRGLPAGIMLNVNIPYLPLEDIQGYRITRQGLRVYRDKLVSRYDPRGQPYYWIGGEEPTGVPNEGTDFGALAQNYVSITPLHLDMTAYAEMKSLSSWTWEETG